MSLVKNKRAVLACWIVLVLGLGLLPVLPIWVHGSPLLLNDLLVAYYCYFQDFHRNWSWLHPFPLWSGSYQCGMPMNAYWQSAYLYPLTWILFGPLAPIHTIYLFYGLHFALAIGGFLLLGPELGLIRIASLWSGLAFGLSGTMLARYEHPTFLAGWSYLPLVLGLYLRSERKPSWRNRILLGAALTLQTLGGHPQATIVTALLLGLFFLRGLCTLEIPRRNLAAPLISVALAAVLCLPLFLPFLDFLGHTERYAGEVWEGQAAAGNSAEEKLSEGVFRFDQFSAGSLRPVHLLSLAAPLALGAPAHATWWGIEPWTETFLFIGTAALLVFFFASPARASPRLRWLGLCGLIALWLAFGAHLFASQILYHIPILNNFRRPARWDILFVLALAAWSGQGFQRWIAGAEKPARWPWIAGVLGLLACVAACVLAASPDRIQHLLRIAQQLKHLDPSRDYVPKLSALMRDWRWDAAIFSASAFALALRSKLGSHRMVPILLVILILDLLRVHWMHFYQFPSDYYRNPPVSEQAMDLSTKPFWRVDHYLEYPGDEMWQMHHDPLRRMDLFEREKTAMGYGIHAIFGIAHVGAHMPLLWPWDSSLTPGEKSARYLLSNRDLDSFHGSPLKPIARYDSVRVYSVLDWKPRIELRPGPATRDSTPPDCPPGFSGYGGLCVQESRDGWVEVRGRFQAGDTLIFREHWHRGWRLRVDGGEWGKPESYSRVFMQHVFTGAANQVVWKF